MDICFCNGPYQFMLLAAAIVDEAAVRARSPSAGSRVFVLTALDTNASFRRQLREAVERSGLATRIVEAWDWPSWPALLSPYRGLFPMEHLRRTLAPDGAQRIWSVLPFHPAERMVASAFEAPIVMFEEGTGSYDSQQYRPATPRDRLADTAFGLAVRHAVHPLEQLPFPVGKGVTRLRHTVLPARRAFHPDWQNRVSAFHGLLHPWLGSPPGLEVPCFTPSREGLAAAARWLSGPSQALDATPRPAAEVPDGPVAVYLGDAHGYGAVQRRASPEAWAELHASQIVRLRRAGYRVLWKGHPRDTTPIAQLLEGRFPDLGRLDPAGDGFLPAEALLLRAGASLVVGPRSTALLTARHALGLPVASYAAAADVLLSRTPSAARAPWFEGIPAVDTLVGG